jgi:hypothetical protein
MALENTGNRIGVDNNFSFQNVNIERGLLWNQEPFIALSGVVPH